MSKRILNQYQPDAVTPPGFYIQEKLGEIGMTQAELAVRIGRTRKTVNEIITGKAPVEPETALQLERVLAVPASFWNSAESLYRDHLVRREERVRLADEVDRLALFPVREMRKRGWLPERSDKVDTLADLLSFFGTASFEAFDHLDLQTRASFRQSAAHRVDPHAVLAWLRKGELDARAIACRPFHKESFRETLAAIRKLTLRPLDGAIRETVALCAVSGVALVVVPELPRTGTWGATRWLTPDKALIQLSARGKTDDQLWFTLFHEAGHILLHPKKDIFIELDDTIDSREDEANRFAADALIPPATWSVLRHLRPRSIDEIRMFAHKYGVAPGIVVGRMQRERMIPWSHCNGLKVRLAFQAAAHS